MPTAIPPVVLRHGAILIHTPQWVTAHTDGGIGDLDAALFAFTDALHDHVRHVDRLTAATLFIRARCGAGWADQPHSGILDTRADADPFISFTSDIVAVAYLDPVHGPCLIVMAATYHGSHQPQIFRQRPGIEWRWWRCVNAVCPNDHRWLLYDGQLYDITDMRRTEQLRPDLLSHDADSTGLRCPCCLDFTELRLPVTPA